MCDLHQLNHNVPENYQGDVVCAGCNFQAADAGDLLRHVGRHAAKKYDRKLCRLCGDFVENMVSHVQSMHKEEYLKYESCLNLSCDQCEQGFRTPIHLATHKLWVHNGKQGQLRCLVCAKPFSTTHQLHAHIETEHTTGLTCVVCQKRCSTYIGLHKHAKRHREIHACRTCGSVFPSVTALNQHQRVHRSVASFKCDLCGKTFQKSLNLAKHKMIVHTDEMRKPRKGKLEELCREGVVREESDNENEVPLTASFKDVQLARHNQSGVIPQFLPLLAQWEEQPSASRVVQREGSPEYPFPSDIRLVAPDALSENSVSPGTRHIREKELADGASEQISYKRFQSLRKRSGAGAGAACNDVDFSDDNDEYFSFTGNYDSSVATQVEYCHEVAADLEGTNTKNRGRKRRMVDAKTRMSPSSSRCPKRTGTIQKQIHTDTADTVPTVDDLSANVAPWGLPPAAFLQLS
ncbi:zinc finger protein 583-like [Paramacrobiotus metropolitanus]|uniref:zinc finger protein 583-like n=1 Tax=Paramacrobiotus metropolitanus TaxID=2943436 RepID=UPI002446169F|nr:zinc finger protein 583-like [Paramacrobiotus metropolitanus]